MDLKNSSEIIHNTSIGCNLTSTTEAEAGQYDAEGALKFTVAVVMVYGVAVMGVFAVSYASRRKPQNYDVDKQARSYVKNMDDVRHKLERKNRLHSINLLLKNIHGDEPQSKEKFIQEGILSCVAFPVMVASGGEQQKANSNDRTNATCSVKVIPPTTPNSGYHSVKVIPPTVPNSGYHSVKVIPPTVPNSGYHSVKVIPPTVPNSGYHSRDTLEVLNEENENEINNDDEVFMNDEERRKFRCDFYVPVS
jgi:hypothetical protein